MPIEIENDEIRITYEQGSSGTTVLAFTGVASGLGSAPIEEFRKSLSAQQEKNSLVFIADKQRTWYNNGLFRTSISVLKSLIPRLSTEKLVAVGNSMGGFGAIVHAAPLGCSKVLAFCPQSSVASHIVPFETRWSEWRNGIREWNVPDAIPTLHSEIDYRLYFGADHQLDAKHAARFSQHGPKSVQVFTLPGAVHDVATRLKEAGKLTQLIHDLIS